jgi:hypothetical protein
VEAQHFHVFASSLSLAAWKLHQCSRATQNQAPVRACLWHALNNRLFDLHHKWEMREQEFIWRLHMQKKQSVTLVICLDHLLDHSFGCLGQILSELFSAG